MKHYYRKTARKPPPFARNKLHISDKLVLLSEQLDEDDKILWDKERI